MLVTQSPSDKALLQSRVPFFIGAATMRSVPGINYFENATWDLQAAANSAVDWSRHSAKLGQ
jgi:hypothetical protein